ncbi:MAG: hypothetical protein HY040_13865 [Planctomycetes bacterium]|nr:hypothetical protein [Planctomycetota bacterium]
MQIWLYLAWREAIMSLLVHRTSRLMIGGVVGASLLGASCLCVPALFGQDGKQPTTDDVKALQSKYQAERDKVLKEGSAKRFLPVLIEKSEQMAKRGDLALSDGRLLQAAEAFRQARWQLPYAGTQMPDHVSRILGNLRLRHGHEVHAVAYSPDGTKLATTSRDRTVKVWDLGNGHESLTYSGHDDQVRAVAFSPDGKSIASGGGDRDIKIWDAATGKDLQTFKGQGAYVTGLVFSKDGKYLVSSQAGAQGQNPGMVVIYEAANGNVKRSINDFRLLVQSIAFNHDGTILGAGVGDGLVKLWDFAKMLDGQPEYWGQQDPNGATYFVAFSPDNRTLARIGADGIKLYNLLLPGAPFQVGSPRRHVPAPGPGNRYTCAAFSKDSRTLFTGSTDGLIKIWNADSLEQTGVYKGHTAEIKALVFNPAGNQLASASNDFTVRLWDFDIVLQARDYAGHDAPVWTSGFSPDGHRMVSASADRTVRIWDVAGGKVLHTLTGHTAPVTYAVFSPDGKAVLSGAGDKLIKLWNADTGALIREFKGHNGTITCLAFSSDGKRFVSGGADRTVKIWDTDSGKDLVTVSDKSLVASVAFLPNGKQVAVGSVDQSIRLYDLDGKRLASWMAHGTAVSCLAFSPNGQMLASCGADNLVRVWPLSTPGQNPITLSGHSGPLSSVAWRNDNQYLVSAGADQTVKLWKLEKEGGKETQTFRGHKDWVTSVAFSKDGFFIVSSGVDRVLKIWELTSREIPLLAEHTGSVDAVAFSPDGKWVASGATDRTIKLWDRATGLEKYTMTGHTEGVLGLAFTPDSKILISSSADRSLRLWEVATGKELPRDPGQQQSYTGLISPVSYFMVPPDGKHLWCWVPGNERYTTMTGFELLTGKEVFSFNDQRPSINCVGFSSDGKRAAIGARDGSVRVFDLENKGQVVATDWFVYDKGTGVGDLALTPDGSLLVAGSDMGDVKICVPAKKETLKTFKAHDAKIVAVQISPDGKRFTTVGSNNAIKLWDIVTASELRQWNLGSTTVSSIAFSPDSRQMVIGNANTTLYVLDLP